MLVQLFSILAPVLVSVGIGFAWVRLGRAYQTDMVAHLVMGVGAPCLVFSTITGMGIPVASLATMALGTVLAIALFVAAGWLVIRALGLNMRGYLPAMMFPNCGNMGLPLSLFAFGEVGLGLAISCFMICSVLHFTVGVGISSGSLHLGRLLKVPVLYAVLAGVAVVVFALPVPAWIADTTSTLGGMTIPLMLISLGVSLGRLRVTAVGRSLGLAGGRLVFGFLVGLGVAEVLGLEGLARGVMILQTSMPMAVFSYLFAQVYDNEPEEVASLVVASTVLSLLLLPLLLWYLLPAQP